MSKALMALLALAVVGAGVYLVMGMQIGGHKNLKVLPQVGDEIGNGMRKLDKGLGVSCRACHVKDAYEKDDLPAKIAARKFFAEVRATEDPAARKAALQALLKVLGKAKANDEAQVWLAFEHWK